MASALSLGFQARFPQQRAPRPLSACWGRIRTARTARVTDERPSQPGAGIAGCSPARLVAAALQNTELASQPLGPAGLPGHLESQRLHLSSLPQGRGPSRPPWLSPPADQTPASQSRRRLPQRRASLLRCGWWKALRLSQAGCAQTQLPASPGARRVPALRPEHVWKCRGRLGLCGFSVLAVPAALSPMLVIPGCVTPTLPQQ